MKDDLAKKTLLTTSQFASKTKFRKRLIAGFLGISGVDKIELSAKMRNNSKNLNRFTVDWAMPMPMS